MGGAGAGGGRASSEVAAPGIRGWARAGTPAGCACAIVAKADKIWKAGVWQPSPPQAAAQSWRREHIMGHPILRHPARPPATGSWQWSRCTRTAAASGAGRWCAPGGTMRSTGAGAARPTSGSGGTAGTACSRSGREWDVLCGVCGLQWAAASWLVWPPRCAPGRGTCPLCACLSCPQRQCAALPRLPPALRAGGAAAGPRGARLLPGWHRSVG